MRTFRMAVLAMLLAPLASFAGDWTLRMDGIGPLRIGMSFNQANAAAGGKLRRTDPALLPSAGCDQVQVPGHGEVWLMFIDGVLARVDDWRPDGHTAAGVAVGDLPQRVLDTWTKVDVAPNAYDESERYLTVRSPDGKLALRFETRGGKIAGFYAGRYKAVQYVEGCL